MIMQKYLDNIKIRISQYIPDRIGVGADYFDCGEGIDTIVDFDGENGDDNAGNCEEIPV